MMRYLLPTLTEAEHAVFLRGRNAAPKHIHQADYQLCHRIRSSIWIFIFNRCNRTAGCIDETNSADDRISSNCLCCGRKSIERMNLHHVRTFKNGITLNGKKGSNRCGKGKNLYQNRTGNHSLCQRGRSRSKQQFQTAGLNREGKSKQCTK